MVPSLPLLSCELSVSVKENPDRKKKNTGKAKFWRVCESKSCDLCKFGSNTTMSMRQKQLKTRKVDCKFTRH